MTGKDPVTEAFRHFDFFEVESPVIRYLNPSSAVYL